MANILQILIGVFILGILVLIHELGHFLAAKLFGIRVISFSIGFGKPIAKLTKGETEYRIGSIPFGGFVHMAGENPDEQQESAPDEFPSKPIWQRAIVALAGPSFNYAFAVAGLWLVFTAGVERMVYLEPPTVSYVAKESAAAEAGLQPGDRIQSINGRHVHSWSDVAPFMERLEQEYVLTVRRDQDTDTVRIERSAAGPGELPQHPLAGFVRAQAPVVGSFSPGSPAKQAGLRKGDTIVAVNEDSVRFWAELPELISEYDSTTGPLSLTVARNGKTITTKITPRMNKRLQRHVIGIGPPTRTVRSGPVQAVGKSVTRSWELVVLTFEHLGKMVRGLISPRELAGPLGIVQMSGGMALLGWKELLSFMSLIGVNLALLNLLPLVITDGGLLLFMVIEAARGKPLPTKYQLIINRIAIAAFILLFLYVTFNDILRIPLLFRAVPK